MHEKEIKRILRSLLEVRTRGDISVTLDRLYSNIIYGKRLTADADSKKELRYFLEAIRPMLAIPHPSELICIRTTMSVSTCTKIIFKLQCNGFTITTS